MEWAMVLSQMPGLARCFHDVISTATTSTSKDSSLIKKNINVPIGVIVHCHHCNCRMMDLMPCICWTAPSFHFDRPLGLILSFDASNKNEGDKTHNDTICESTKNIITQHRQGPNSRENWTGRTYTRILFIIIIIIIIVFQIRQAALTVVPVWQCVF